MPTINDTPPTLENAVTNTRAWQVDLATAANPNPNDATVALWIVNAPWSHPFWPNVAVFCIHLRDVPGQTQAPHRYFPEATHEIGVYALNPDAPPVDLQKLNLPFLSPPNYIGQFTAATDAHAALVVERAVQEICAGVLNPDSDGRAQWKARFGSHAFKPSEPGSVGEAISNGGTVIVIPGVGNIALMPPNPDEPTPGDTKH